MSLPRLALRNPIVVGTLTALAVGYGTLAFLAAPRRSDPTFTVRQARVVARWPGVESERVERLVTDPLEREIARLEEVEHVLSETTTGLSVIEVRAYENTAGDTVPQIWDRVRARVSDAHRLLPDGVAMPVVEDDFGDTAVLQIAVFSGAELGPGFGNARTYSPRELREFAELIRDRFRLEDGVARAEIYGAKRERIELEVDPADWAASAVTIPELQRALDARNTRASGGGLDLSDRRIAVLPTGEFDGTREIGNVVIRRGPTGAPIRVRDLGIQVRRTYIDPPDNIVRFGDDKNSTEAVIVSVVMRDEAQATRIGPHLVQLAESMRNDEKVLPPDLGIRIVFDEAGFVAGKINSFLLSLLQAILVVVGVAYLLVGARSSFVMAAAIPVVMISSFGFATLLGVALEQMSIASLILSLGIMVDNAVVVSDNARRLMKDGLSRFEAVARGVSEVLVPTLMGTLTTVFVFLPMAFALDGPRVEYVFSIPAVVSLTLLTSWVVAMSLTALLAYVAIRPIPEGRAGSPIELLGRGIDRITARLGLPRIDVGGAYSKAIRGALRTRWAVLGCSLLLLIGSFMLPIGNQFFPDDERDQFYVDVWTPDGSSLQATARIATEVEDLIRQEGHKLEIVRSAETGAGDSKFIRSIYTSIGGSGPRFSSGVNPTAPTPNFAQIILTTDDAKRTGPFVEHLIDLTRKEFTGARVIPRRYMLGPPVPSPVAIRVMATNGDDPGFADIEQLRYHANRIQAVLEETDGLWDVHNSWGEGHAVANRVRVDSSHAEVAGVSSTDVATTLAAYLDGQPLTSFRDGNDAIPVVFRFPRDIRQGNLLPEQLFVEGRTGKIPLSALADIELVPALDRIERRDNQRTMELRARQLPGFLANELVAEAMVKIDATIKPTLPPGMTIEIGGEFEEAEKAGGQVGLAYGIGFLLLTLVMVFQYSSLLKPAVVLTTLPMGMIGALGGLFAFDSALGFMPMLGLVALAGMVVNSAILYLEFADRMLENVDWNPALDPAERKMQVHDALAEAGRIRLLPILLTALTTIGGFLPLQFGGPLWEGMASAMIGGLAVATLLTLIVLPVVYEILITVFGFCPVAQREPAPVETVAT